MKISTMEEDSKTESSVITEEEQRNLEDNGNKNGIEDQHVLQLLDSADDYLTLLDSVSSTLRQGWLELTSARHSMGAMRVNGALLDMKSHTAATVLQVTEDDNLKGCNAQFTLCKWENTDTGKYSFGEEKIREDKLHKKPNSPQLRHRSISHVSETPEKTLSHDGALLVDDQVQRERAKSLSVFGTLVSPKLRDAQLSFETALEKLVEIANARGRMICAYNQIRN